MHDEDLDDYDRRELAERQAARDAAAARHAGNLAIMDALLALEAEASATPWRAQRVPTSRLQGTDVAELQQVSDVPDRGFYLVTSGSFYGPDVALVAALRNAAAAQLAARRRVLERHRPDPSGSVVDCNHCIDAGENPYRFPCADYLDAEAGLVMPHRVLMSLDEAAQMAAAACTCCGWSRTFGYARSTGAPVAERLAEVWAGRHTAGDPDAQLDNPTIPANGAPTR